MHAHYSEGVTRSDGRQGANGDKNGVGNDAGNGVGGVNGDGNGIGIENGD